MRNRNNDPSNNDRTEARNHPRRPANPNDSYRRFEEERAHDRLTYDGREAPDMERRRREGEDQNEPFAGPHWPQGPSFTSQFYGPFADREVDPTPPRPQRARNRADYSQEPRFPNDHAMHQASYGYDEHAYGQMDEDMASSDDRTTYSRQFLKPYGGVGPKGYTRSDERIREDVCEILLQDRLVDARDIEVEVQSGEVTLTGTVRDRRMKLRAEDLIQVAAGVKDIHNQLRLASKEEPQAQQ